MPWPKGRKQSEEHKAKNSKALKGRMFTKSHHDNIAAANRRRTLGKKFPERSRENNGKWKGGTYYKGGYKYIMVKDESGPPAHPKYQREHILIAERALGRRLKKGEVVHHINCEKTDNRNQNLMICTQSYHKFIEDRMARLYAQEHFGGQP